MPRRCIWTPGRADRPTRRENVRPYKGEPGAFVKRKTDCRVGFYPPRNDTSSVSLRLTPSPQGEGGGFRVWGPGKRIATQWSNAEQVPLGYDQSADWSRNDRIRAGRATRRENVRTYGRLSEGKPLRDGPM